ncbi:MAG TPA: cation transporter [Actinomycetota bacterium]|nr:cation transporter [Actinomycetota bacterium]
MRETFRVPDVSCGHCKSSIETALHPLNGIEKADVDLEAKAVLVDFDEGVVDRATVVRAIESAGYPVAG